MKIEIYEKKWTIENVKNEPKTLFVFEDNNLRVGNSDKSSLIRGLKNTSGIRVKKGPSKNNIAFYTDNEYNENIKNIDEDIFEIKKKSKNYDKIAFYEEGYGNISSRLEDVAPKTYKYLYQSLINNFSFNNKDCTKYNIIPGHDMISGATRIPLDKKGAILSNVVQPITNNLYRKDLLEKEFNTIYDLIKSENKIAFTQNVKYNPGEILILDFSYAQEDLICLVTNSYNIDYVDTETWLYFEGFSDKILKDMNEVIDNSEKYYQTQFRIICSLNKESGKLLYDSEIFGDSKLYENNKIKNYQKIGENYKNLSKIELLSEIDKMKIEIDFLKSNKKSFNLKNPINKILSKFKKKNLQQLLDENNLNGELIEIESDDQNAKTFKLKSKNETYLIVYNEGIFKNTIKKILIDKV